MSFPAQPQFRPHPAKVIRRASCPALALGTVLKILDQRDQLGSHGLQSGRMARRSIPERRDRLVQPLTVVPLVVFADNLGLKIGGNLGTLALRCGRPELQCLTDIFVTGRPKFDCSSRNLAKEVSSLLGALPGSGFKHKPVTLKDERPQATLKCADIFEPRIAPVAVIIKGRMASQRPHQGVSVHHIKYDLCEDEGVAFRSYYLW